jgi:hypothetical protein
LLEEVRTMKLVGVLWIAASVAVAALVEVVAASAAVVVVVADNRN